MLDRELSPIPQPTLRRLYNKKSLECAAHAGSFAALSSAPTAMAIAPTPADRPAAVSGIGSPLKVNRKLHDHYSWTIPKNECASVEKARIPSCEYRNPVRIEAVGRRTILYQETDCTLNLRPVETPLPRPIA